MPRVYELPTHLQVEDVLIAGLTARQLLRLMIGASLAYGVWDQAGWLAQDVRLIVAVVPAVVGGLVALLQPGGPPLDQWVLAGVLVSCCRGVWSGDLAPCSYASHRANSQVGPSSSYTPSGSGLS